MAPPSADSPLILASTSRYRAEALSKLGIRFIQLASGVDESELGAETPEQRAIRLSLAKARAVALEQPDRWVVGSDQVAACEGRILHKPGSPQANIDQLMSLSGRQAQFHSGIALVCGSRELTALDTTRVQFRRLGRQEVERYVAREPAHDCAGGFKVEGLGISLFESIHSEDPSGLVGLPLIALRRLLAAIGLPTP